QNPTVSLSFFFFFFFFVASELMDLVNHQGFLAAQPLHMDTARMNLTTTATEHDKTARSANNASCEVCLTWTVSL
uniref:Uncharacterized protein n=1 Tax=Accipiter nisus TaxID=211598 RepID=A0A8B9NDW5_9AVES